jgi:hypothetical protein
MLLCSETMRSYRLDCDPLRRADDRDMLGIAMRKAILLAVLLFSAAYSQQPPKQVTTPHAYIESYNDGVIKAHIIDPYGRSHPSFTATCSYVIRDYIQTGVQTPKECLLGKDIVGQEIPGIEPKGNQDGNIRYAGGSESGKLFVLMQERSGNWLVEFFKKTGTKSRVSR